MSWLFLILGVVSAWLTYHVRHPLQNGYRARIFGFFASWLWGELALHIVAAHALIVLLFALGGAIDGLPGFFGLLLMAGSCVALVNLYLDSGRAALIMERVLRNGLGENYEEAIAPELRSKLERSVRWRDLARPFRFDRPEVEVVRDIRFAREKGLDLKLDIHRHRMVTERAPVLLQIHGGAWTIAYKDRQAQPLLAQMASRGWVCVNCDYRLSPHATFPEHLIDCKRAIQWIKENIESYGGDPDFIVVTGGSAGGHLSALLALTANDERYQPGFEDVDTNVRACVPFYGVYDMANRHGFHTATGLPLLLEKTVLKGACEEIPELYRDASPMDAVRADAPPFLLIHGGRDTLAPVEEARVFSELLGRESEAPVLYAELPDAQHGFDVFHCLRGQQVVDGVERFAQFVYSEYLSTPAGKTRSKPTARSKKSASGGKAGADAGAGRKRQKRSGGSPAKADSPANGDDRPGDDAEGRIARLPQSKQEGKRARPKSKSTATKVARIRDAGDSDTDKRSPKRPSRARSKPKS